MAKHVGLKLRQLPALATGGNIPTVFLGLILVVLLTFSPGGSIARASGAGISGAEFLRENAGARSSAMAGAGVALVDNGYTLFSNPAAMSRLRQAHFSATHQDQVLDVKKETLGLNLPLAAHHTLGFGGRFEHSTDYERGEFYDGDEFTNYSGSLGSYYAYGSEVGVAWGGGVKLIRERLAGYNARSHAVDLGLHYQSPRSPLRLGVLIENLGPEITFIEEGDPLPRTFRIGWAYDFPIARQRLTVASDLIYYQPENITSIALGAEFRFNRFFKVRGGYASPDDYSENGKIHGGLGINLGALDFDYSLSSREELDNQHRFTLSLRFGARPAPGRPERPRPREDELLTPPAPEEEPEEVAPGEEPTYRRLNERAEEHFEAGNYRRAIELWQESLEEREQPRIYRRIAQAYYELGEFDKAREYMGVDN